MRKKLLIISLLLPLVAFAKSDTTDVAQRKVLTGFSGGMLLHIGYSFSDSPAELFQNARLMGAQQYFQSLPRDGVTLGLGGQLRFHLLDHMHLGGEGYVSVMPLAHESSIRTGWGGVFLDGYLTAGPVRPLIGLGLGGGSTKRLFVPQNIGDVIHWSDSICNASYSKTPFFYLDPYIGIEVLFGADKRKVVHIRLDYLLPFGKRADDTLEHLSKSALLTPTGPRLYIGIMFGKQK